MVHPTAAVASSSYYHSNLLTICQDGYYHMNLDAPPTVHGREKPITLHLPSISLPGAKNGCLPCGTRMRFVLLIVVLLCVASIWSNVLTFNFAIICMIPNREFFAIEELNATQVQQQEDDDENIYFSPAQKSFLTSTVAIGALISYFPIVYLIHRFQIRTVFTFVGLLSATATALIPPCIGAGFLLIVLMRFLQGVAFAANFPVIGAFVSKWTYHKQSGLFVSVLVAYVQLSPAITNPVSGALCEHSGWPSVFYVHAGFGAFIFFVFDLLHRNSPQRHPFVGPVEIMKITHGKVESSKHDVVPIRQILSSITVWAAWIGAVGNFFCVNLMFLYTSVYLHRVHDYSAKETGLTSAIPAIAEYFVKVGCGFASDKLTFISPRTRLRLFNSVATFGSAAFLIALACMDAEQHVLNVLYFPSRPFVQLVCLLLLLFATGILGGTAAGFFKSSQLISQQYSHLVTGAFSLVVSATMLIVPPMVAGIAPQNRQDQWKWIFVITAVVLVDHLQVTTNFVLQILTNIFFVIFCSAEPCDWTRGSTPRATPSPQVKQQPPPPTYPKTHHYQKRLARIARTTSV